MGCLRDTCPGPKLTRRIVGFEAHNRSQRASFTGKLSLLLLRFKRNSCEWVHVLFQTGATNNRMALLSLGVGSLQRAASSIRGFFFTLLITVFQTLALRVLNMHPFMVIQVIA